MKKLLTTLGAVGVIAAIAVPALASTKTVKIGDNFFVRSSNNATVSIKRGSKIVWKWTGTAPHNVTVTSGPKKFHSRTQSSGSFSAIPHTPGTYKIVCTIHPGMKMTLRVKAGTKIVWKWTGHNPHNVTVTSGPRKFHSKTQTSGTFTAIPHKKGTYSIICTIHGFQMTLVVK